MGCLRVSNGGALGMLCMQKYARVDLTNSPEPSAYSVRSARPDRVLRLRHYIIEFYVIYMYIFHSYIATAVYAFIN